MTDKAKTPGRFLRVLRTIRTGLSGIPERDRMAELSDGIADAVAAERADKTGG